ncbi:NAD-dependent epimerase/dehydratase family protein [Vagococcus sp. WN89Y]|uniref:NAD-dependent epimerase/dehydratase family protein n=1 Tax=Vagococcus sp. WN89Y TaxID=3457258 RepID=UPI003FCCAC7F
MKILVTGGTGFLGSNLVRELKTMDHEVIISTRQCENVDEGIFNLGDISSETDWKHILQGCDIVIHTAGRAHILKDTVADKLAEFRGVNRDATLKLAQDAAECNVKHFIFVSSIGVNGNLTNGVPFTENSAPNPVSEYAISKYEAEEKLMQYFIGGNMSITIIRPALICGINAPGNIQRLLNLVSKNIPLPFKGVQNKRAMVSLDNVVSFIIECINNAKAKDQLYLLADKGNPSTEEIIQVFSSGMGKSPMLITFPKSIMKLCLSVIGKGSIYEQLFGDLEVNASKACEQLGWTPTVTLNETMRKTAEYYNKGNR